LDLFEAREVLETGIARLSAERITDDELSTLDLLVEESAGCVDDPLGFLALDLRLHGLVALACRNTLLIKMADSVAALARESRNRTTRIDAVRHRALEDHRALAAALRAHDPDESEAAMKSHLRTVKAGYLGGSKSRPPPATPAK
jgi:GntR family transcriptional repressor for pyruvate dehydrogenase complex